MQHRPSWSACLSLSAFACVAACSGDPAVDGSESAVITPASGPIAASDFTKPLDATLLRTTNQELSDSQFSDKLQTARGTSAFMFYRTFPGAFHGDLAQVPAEHILGVEGLCFGDAHPDNFGFLHLGDQTLFAFNDLDDSGFCPIALDVARYIGAVELDFANPALVDDVLTKYIDVLGAPDHATTLPASLLPDWDKVRSKGLAKSVAQDKLIVGTDLSAPSDADRAAILAMIQGEPRLASLTLKDVAEVQRDDGGSAGLRRFWLLVTKGSVDTILELKEAARPGVELGRHTQALSFDERLGRLKDAFWHDGSTDDNYYVQVASQRFLVRDRLLKKSLDLSGLDPDTLKTTLEAQASYLATHHAASWKSTDKAALRDWLSASGHVLAERWKTGFAAR